MRLAFIITAIEAITTSIDVFEASDLFNVKNPPKVRLTWIRADDNAKSWTFHIAQVDNFSMDAADILKAVAKIVKDANSPLMTARAIVENNGTQLAYLEGKIVRPTIVSDKKQFKLVGIDMTVEAEDAKTAKRVGKYAVATRMAADGNAAETLAKWFSDGCTVEEVTADEGVTPVAIADLAANSRDEKAIAKTPITRKLGAVKSA